MSADILLGLENKGDEKIGSNNYSEEVLNNLRFCLEPLMLSFGKDLVQIFLKHMIQILGSIVRENYGEVLSRDLMKDLTDNLKLSHPALIEGVVPEKISYGLLQEVYKQFMARGNSPKYLPKLIENLENDLYTNPEISVGQLVEQACRRLSRLSYDVS